MSMEEYLPVKVSTYGNKGENEKAIVDEVVLADIVDEDDEGMGTFAIAFNIKSVRYFIEFRKIDLRNALAPESAASENCDAK